MLKVCGDALLCEWALFDCIKELSVQPEPEISTFRPDRSGIRTVLGDLEAEIMELVWARPAGQGVTVREIFEILYEQRRLAYTTVMNTMTRLARKNLLRVEKAEQAYIYYPNFTQEEFISRFVGRILENLLMNFTGAAINGLTALTALPDAQAAEQARSYLEEITRRREKENE